jgi:hypothetical protein
MMGKSATKEHPMGIRRRLVDKSVCLPRSMRNGGKRLMSQASNEDFEKMEAAGLWPEA